MYLLHSHFGSEIFDVGETLTIDLLCLGLVIQDFPFLGKFVSREFQKFKWKYSFCKLVGTNALIFLK